MQNALLNLVELARVAEKAGLNSVAIQLLLKYVNATANHSFPRFLLSQCYLAVGNLVEALRHLDQVTHFPEDHSSDLLMLRAKIFEELGDYTRSEVFHLQAIEGDGTVFEPRIEYARFLAGCGRLDEALTAIESIEKNCIEMDHDELHELEAMCIVQCINIA